MAGDWNWDVANCMLQNLEGYEVPKLSDSDSTLSMAIQDSDSPSYYNRTGMVIEGDPDRIPDLVEKFAGRDTEVDKHLKPLHFDDVQGEMKRQV